jgi:hypothetical protein
MTTVELAPRGPFAKPQTGEAVRGGPPVAATGLLGALVVLLLYAAFDHGAGAIAASARIQVVLAVIATAAAAVSLWSGTLRFSAPRLATAGVALLALFAVWSGISLAWSVAPAQTWSELNRDLTYVVVLVLAVMAGASHPRALRLASDGTLLVVLAVTVYAIGQKLVPGLHVPGLFNLNRTQLVPRLQDPFGYWNALGLFIAFGVPLALAIVLDGGRPTRVRLGALLSVELMLLTIGLTYSRGAVLALVCGLAVGIGLSRARLRSLMWIGAAAVATVPPLVFGLVSHNLTNVSVSLGSRELAGAELTAVLLISFAALWIGGERLMELERSVQVGPEQSRRIGKGLVVAAAVVLLCGVLAVTVSSRGLTGTVSHAWHTFTRTQETTNYDPGRLLSADSANRWVWWKEAVGAFSDRPLTGWGAGSFPVVHLLYRRNAISVQQPHSVPLQFLAETGVIGALLAICGFGLLIAAGVRSVRVRGGAERLAAAALLAGVVAYAVHTLYDWDWDIPGVTLPALVFAGVLAGSYARRRGQERVVGRGVGPMAGALALSGITALLCAYALSGVVPSVAASKANSALVSASSSSRAVLEHARTMAEAATRLDPLSDAGLLTSETIAQHLGEVGKARTYLLEALKRDPTDTQVWQRLVYIEGVLRDAPAERAVVQRLAALDPMSAGTMTLVRDLEFLRAPPNDSATRGPTPLSPAQAP